MWGNVGTASDFSFLTGMWPETLRRICIHLLNTVHEFRHGPVGAILHAQSALMIAANVYFDE
jgi:hypothetical protein